MIIIKKNVKFICSLESLVLHFEFFENGANFVNSISKKTGSKKHCQTAYYNLVIIFWGNIPIAYSNNSCETPIKRVEIKSLDADESSFFRIKHSVLPTMISCSPRVIGCKVPKATEQMRNKENLKSKSDKSQKAFKSLIIMHKLLNLMENL